MSKQLNLNGENVQEIDLTREEIHNFFEGVALEDLENALDTAQRNVQVRSPQYIVIKIE